MKIAICGSMSASKEMVAVGLELTNKGHEVILPKHTEDYANNLRAPETHQESAQNKIEGDLIRDYYKEIKHCDALLVVNIDKNNLPNYIGGNTLIEMAFAHVLNKKLFILNGLPNAMSYYDEIVAMSPDVLGGDISLVE